ncbi:hypothetical protein BURMUCF2_1116 [Burkholderia multivorans CF2]|nr:hypothetical protein BURMUCF2_1116 [Burkholderia multivorans CF2]
MLDNPSSGASNPIAQGDASQYRQSVSLRSNEIVHYPFNRN